VVVRVATYTRRSTDEEHQPFSIEAQDAKLAAYISSQDGWHHMVGCTFTDNMTGSVLDRPGLQQALVAARAKRFDILLVYKVDRLARSIRGLAQLLDELDTAGVAFRSATEPFDTSTPAGRMMVQMLGVFAEFERRTIIDRVIAGMERKAARGQWTAGSHPFGYATEKPKPGETTASGFLVPLAGQAPLVPVIFDLYANKRMGARAIAAWLNDRNYRTRAGRPWGVTGVLTVLRNRAYLGQIYFRGTWHPAPHLPLVEPTLFDAVQELLAERGEDKAKRASNASDYLLSGKLHCGWCHKRFVGTAATGKLARYRYYTCFSRSRYGTSTCAADRLPADQLDLALLEMLLFTFEQSDLIEQAVADTAAKLACHRDDHHAELDVVQAELRRTEQAMDRYMLAFEQGKLDLDRFSPRVEALAVKADELSHRQDELVAALEQAEAQPPSETLLESLRERIRETIDLDEIQPKKTLVNALVHDIEVRGRSEIFPTFRVPTAPDPDTSVRTLSGLVGVTGLEPVTSSL